MGRTAECVRCLTRFQADPQADPREVFLCSECRADEEEIKRGHWDDAIRYRMLAEESRRREEERRWYEERQKLVDPKTFFKQEYLGEWPLMGDEDLAEKIKTTRKRVTKKNKTLERFLKHGRR